MAGWKISEKQCSFNWKIIELSQLSCVLAERYVTRGCIIHPTNIHPASYGVGRQFNLEPIPKKHYITTVEYPK
jgi:hypothetical protein